jgi:L-iditol 2-dehydrogenase
LETARKLGADETIDVAKVGNVVDAVRGLTPNGRGADVAIDATGLPETWEKNLYMVRKAGTVMEFGGCKGGSTITVDTTLLHYSQLNVKGLYHTTPRLVEQSFLLIQRGEITEDVFVDGTYPLDQCLNALESHARGEVIKNEIRCDL